MSTMGSAPGTSDDPATVALQRLDPGFRGELAWRQPRMARRRWLLLADGMPCATLQNRGLLRDGWRMRTARGAWHFPPRWLGNMIATTEGATEPVARFRPGWLGNGRIERAGQSTLKWTRTSFWRGRWELQTSEDHSLVRFQAQRRLLRIESTVELDDAGRRLPDLEPLIGFGWILALSERRGHWPAH